MSENQPAPPIELPVDETVPEPVEVDHAEYDTDVEDADKLVPDFDAEEIDEEEDTDEEEDEFDETLEDEQL